MPAHVADRRLILHMADCAAHVRPRRAAGCPDDGTIAACIRAARDHARGLIGRDAWEAARERTTEIDRYEIERAMAANAEIQGRREFVATVPERHPHHGRIANAARAAACIGDEPGALGRAQDAAAYAAAGGWGLTTMLWSAPRHQEADERLWQAGRWRARLADPDLADWPADPPYGPVTAPDPKLAGDDRFKPAEPLVLDYAGWEAFRAAGLAHAEARDARMRGMEETLDGRLRARAEAG